MVRRTRSTLLVALLLGVAATACSSGGSTPSAGSTTSTSSTTVASTSSSAPGGVDPNATEVVAPGDIPDNQAFVAYTPPGAHWSVKVPEGWARTTDGAATVFTDKYNSVRMEATAAVQAPTVESAKQHDVPAVQAANANVEIRAVTAVSRTAGAAVLISYRANGTPNPVTGKSPRLEVERYEFWHGGTEVILTLSGAQGADNVDPWKIVTDSLAWQP